jgi:uncharacterized protein YdhG (YjbR/CyaY superfamily)
MAKQVISVTDYLHSLDHPLKNLVEELRKIMLSADKEIDEQIKWNSLSFYYTGEIKSFDPKEYKRDIVVLNLHKKDQVLLVFPTGAGIDDKTGILGGMFKDTRKIVTFTTLDEVKHKEKDLQLVIKQWLQTVER